MATASDTLPHEPEQPVAHLAFAAIDGVKLCDELADDRVAVRGVYLALWGLQDHGADQRDLHAVSDLIMRLEDRLKEREGQAEELKEAIANRSDACALQTPSISYWHRDAGLVDAWKQWQAAMRAYIEGDNDDLYETVQEAERRIEGMHARTPVGLAVKARLLFCDLEVMKETQDALVYDRPITDEMLQDGRERFSWSVVQNIEQLIQPVAA